MQRILSVLALAGLLFGLLPPATCMGMGQACCCSPTTTPVTGSETPARSPEHVLSASGSSCRCACPELSGAPPDSPPATRAASPTLIAAPGDASPWSLARAFQVHEGADLAAHFVADPDPPPAARLARQSVLRL